MARLAARFARLWRLRGGVIWSLLVILSMEPEAAELPLTSRLVPSFDFTALDFDAFAQKYLEAAQLTKVQRQGQRAEFLRLVAAVIKQEREQPYLAMLVDKQHALAPNYVPRDLVALREYPSLNLARGDLRLRSLAVTDLLAMNAAAVSDGVSLVIGSAYRSFTYQQELFARYAQRQGKAAANRYSARAGHSQHQLGLALDFVPIRREFAATAAGQWLHQHALNYGFSLSYPQDMEAITGYIFEPWHYRYVGRIIAQLIAQYFSGVQQKFYLFWLKGAPELKRHYQPPITQKAASKNY